MNVSNLRAEHLGNIERAPLFPYTHIHLHKKLMPDDALNFCMEKSCITQGIVETSDTK